MNASLGSRTFAVQTMIPERYQDAISAGVRFIELHFPIVGDYPKSVMGFYNISVKSYVEPGAYKPTYSIRLLAGQSAHITFEKLRRDQIGVAFCPDDLYMHNRFMLVDNPAFHIAQLHTRDDGIVPGSIIKSEIQAFKEVIDEQVEIFKIVNRFNSEYCFYYSREEAEEGKKRYQNWKDLSIVPGVKWKRKKNVLELIRKYKRLQYGWTSCEEFKNEIIPQIKAKIEEKARTVVLQGQMASNPLDLKSQILNVLKSLSPEERKIFLAEADSKKAEVNQNQQSQEQEQQDQNAPVKYTKSGLLKIRLEELQSIAKNFNIDITGKPKGALSEEILYEQELQQYSQQQSPLLPVPENVHQEEQEQEEEEVIT